MNSTYLPENTIYINHFNPDDWALAATKWQINQQLKPDVKYGYRNNAEAYYYRRDRVDGVSTLFELQFPDDRYEVFSYGARARSYATGTEGATGGVFNIQRSVNLKDQFSFEAEHKGHSAQFRSHIQKRWAYWQKAMQDMQVPGHH